MSGSTPDNRLLPEVEAALNQVIDVIRDRLREGYPKVALAAFEEQLRKLASGATPYVAFRLKANIGHCHLHLGDRKTALEWFDAAYAAAPTEPKAMAIKTYALTLRDEVGAAVAFARAGLEEHPDDEELAASLIEASIHDKDLPDPAASMMPALRQRERVLVAMCLLHRDREDRPTWWNEARNGARLYPGNRLLRLYAAEAEVDRIARAARSDRYRPFTDEERASLREAAETLDGIWRQIKGSEVPSREDGLSALSTLALAYRLLEEAEAAVRSVSELVDHSDYGPALMLAAQVATAFDAFDVAGQALAKLPDNGGAGFLKGVAAFNQGDWGAAATLFEQAEIPADEQPFVETVLRIWHMKGSSDPGDATALDRARITASSDSRSLVVISRLARLRGFAEVAEAAYRDVVALLGSALRIPDRITLATYARDRDDATTVIQALDGQIDQGVVTTELQWLSDAHACETPPRHRNRRFFDSLAEAVRTSPAIARGHAAALSAAGDFEGSERILRSLLQIDDTDTFIHLKLVDALRHLDRDAGIASLVRSCDEGRLKGPPGHRMAWAHELRRAGQGTRAVAMGYDLVRQFPFSPELALGYVGLILGRPDDTLIRAHESVAAGCWVHIESERGEQDSFVVDTGISFLGTDVVPESHDRARNVLGLRVGGSFVVTGMMGRRSTWTVKEIKDRYLHALHVILRTFRQRFPTAQGLDQLTLPEDGIEPLLDIVKDDAEARRKFVEETYVANHFPLAVVASAAGKDPFTLAEYLRRQKIDIVTADGTLADRQAGMALALEYRGIGAVLDTYTAVVAAEIGMLPTLKAWFGRLTVTRQTVDQLQELAADAAGHMGRRSLSVEYVDGYFVRHEVTEEVVKDQLERIRAVRRLIETECEVRQAIYPDDVPDHMAEFARRHGRPALDPMVLAAHQGDLLLTDDLPCRAIATVLTGVDGSWLQAVLLAAREENAIEPAELARLYVELAGRRHTHFWLDMPSLIVLYDECSAQAFETVVGFVGGPGAEMHVHTVIIAQTLGELWRKRPNDLKLHARTSAIMRSLLRHRGDDWAQWLSFIWVHAVDTPGLRSFLNRWLVGHFLPTTPVDEAVGAWQAMARQKRAA